MHCILEVVLDEAGEPTGVVGTGQDITDTVRAKRELERVSRRYETMLTVVGESLADRDPLTLLRLCDGDELVTPSSFVPTAERLGTVIEIDEWVIDRAITLLGDPANRMRIQVNVSGSSLVDRRLIRLIRRRLDERPFDARRLVVEVTETALIANLTAARRFADELRSLGCQLALDDFGSGHGPFTNLKHLPFDMVKIDGEFIVNLLANKTDQIMLRSIVEMCKAMGIQTVAECVEDTTTLRVLQEYGVDFAQGYAVGRPTRPEELIPARRPLPLDPGTDRIQRLGPYTAKARPAPARRGLRTGHAS